MKEKGKKLTGQKQDGTPNGGNQEGFEKGQKSKKRRPGKGTGERHYKKRADLTKNLGSCKKNPNVKKIENEPEDRRKTRFQKKRQEKVRGVRGTLPSENKRNRGESFDGALSKNFEPPGNYRKDNEEGLGHFENRMGHSVQ